MNREQEAIVAYRRKQIRRNIHRIIAGGLAAGATLMLAARQLIHWLFG